MKWWIVCIPADVRHRDSLYIHEKHESFCAVVPFEQTRLALLTSYTWSLLLCKCWWFLTYIFQRKSLIPLTPLTWKWCFVTGGPVLSLSMFKAATASWPGSKCPICWVHWRGEDVNMPLWGHMRSCFLKFPREWAISKIMPGLPSGYVKIAIENGYWNSGFSHWKWWIFP